MSTPAPTNPLGGSKSGRPIMALFDLLGRRWTLRIFWELRDESLTFNGLQRRCDGMSTSVLSQRLKELQAAALIEKRDNGMYALSEDGVTLLGYLSPLNDWAEAWSRQIRPLTTHTPLIIETANRGDRRAPQRQTRPRCLRRAGTGRQSPA